MDILDNRKVKTRKSHICHGCQKLIPAKTEDVDYKTIACDGYLYSVYNCKRCEEWLNRNPDYFDDEYHEGDIREAMKDMGEWDLRDNTKLSTESA